MEKSPSSDIRQVSIEVVSNSNLFIDNNFEFTASDYYYYITLKELQPFRAFRTVRKLPTIRQALKNIIIRFRQIIHTYKREKVMNSLEMPVIPLPLL